MMTTKRITANDLKEKPNIVFVIVDDMGIHQLGCYGNPFYETPNLDRLAAESMRFTDAYGTGPVCSPSRASILTGKYPARLHLTNFIPGSEPENPKLITPEWQKFLPLEEATVGNVFQDFGYITGHFGKWHLAKDYHHRPGRPLDPQSQGFHFVTTSVKPKPDANPTEDAHNTGKITDWAIQFLKDQKDNNFLSFIEYNTIHRPEMEHPDLVAKYAAKSEADDDKNRPVLGAMVETLDRNIGRLLETLENLGLAENTIVVFTSDHGMWGDTQSLKPLRGAKADLYEGGIRVPLMIRWPGVVKSRTVCSIPVCGNDFLPTLMEAIGLERTNPDVDGVSLLPLLKQDGQLRRDAIFWHYPHYHHQGIAPSGAVRQGNFKLIEWFEKSIIDGPESEGALELFDLTNDIGEQNNLFEEKMELGWQLYEKLKAWRQSVGAQEMTINNDFNSNKEASKATPPEADS